MADTVIDKLINYTVQGQINKENAIKYARENYHTVMKTNRFTNIPFYVIKLILESDVNATATQICDSVLSWLFRNKVPPFEGFHLILETVRIHNLTMRYIEQRIEPYVGHLPYYSILMTLNLQFYAINSILKRKTNNNIRKNSDKLIFIADEGRGQFTLEIFNLAHASWTYIKIPITLHPGFGVCLIDRFLFFVGGLYENRFSDNMIMFNMRNGKCTKLQQLRRKRSNVAVAVVASADRDFIYVIGGNCRAIKTTSFVERWDSQTRKWVIVRSMNHPRSCMNAVVRNGNIYVAGGYGSDPSGFEEFNPDTGRWKILPRMNEPRRFCMIAAHKEMMYAVGGSNFSTQFLISTVERYNFSINKWQYISSLPKPMRGLPCSLGNKLIFAPVDIEEPCILEYVEDNGSWKEMVDIIAQKQYVALFKSSD